MEEEEEERGGYSREVRILLTLTEHTFPNKMEEDGDHENSIINWILKCCAWSCHQIRTTGLEVTRVGNTNY